MQNPDEMITPLQEIEVIEANKPKKEKPAKVKAPKVKLPKEKSSKPKKVKEKKATDEKKVKPQFSIKEKGTAVVDKIKNLIQSKVPAEDVEVTDDKVSFLSSIRVKLFVAFLIPICLFIITGILIYNRCSNTLISNSETSTYTTLTTLNEYFESGFEAASLIATRLSINDTVVNAYSKSSTAATTTPVTDAAVIVSNEGTAEYLVAYITVIGDGFQSATSKGAKSADGYNAFIQSDAGKLVAESESKITWIGSHPELDEVLGYDTDAYALSGVMPFNNRFNKQAGYILVDIKTEYVTDILANSDFGDDSIVSLINSDGSEVTVGTEDFTFYDKEFYQTVLASGLSGSDELDYEGTDYAYVYTPVESTGGMVCALVPRDNILSGVKAIRIYLVVAICICAVFALLLGNLLSNNISRAIVSVNKTLRKTSNGDLTHSLKVNRKDEFKALTFNLNHMIDSMKNLIQKMSHVSNTLTDSAGTVGTNAQLLLDLTNNITEAVGYIDDGITQQSSDTENCLHQMSDLATKIGVVQNNASEIGNITSTTQSAVNNGMVIVSDLSSHVSDTTNVTKAIIEEINLLNQETAAINDIIETIEDIAAETELLSLNASIEAARAGDAGRGFAVVADNIRKFATRSDEAAEEIRKIVGALQNRMTNTITTAGKASEIVAEQEVSLKSTINIFSEIKDNIATLVSDIENINVSLESMEEAKNDTMLAIESISATSNETEAASNELSKSVKEQLNSVEELNNAVKHLQDNAVDLDTSVSIFKIN